MFSYRGTDVARLYSAKGVKVFAAENVVCFDELEHGDSAKRLGTVTNYLSRERTSLATLLLARILGPKKTSTHGTTVSNALIPPSNELAPGVPSLSNMALVNNGKTAARMFRQKLCAANADDAYRWYTSGIFC